MTSPRILTINGGSSSIRFALFEAGVTLERGLHGHIDRIGLDGTTLSIEDPQRDPPASCVPAVATRATVSDFLIDRLETHRALEGVEAVGHRVVHGMKHAEPEPVGAALLGELRRITPYDPEHLPLEIELIEAFRRRHPALPQVACFDTAFHRSLPRVARLLPIPRRYEARGVQRYGFHGLSYAYLLGALERRGDPAARRGRVVLAHLGNGASMAAVRDGRCIDTTMAFTPASGLPMSTRSGDLDPGLFSHLARTEGMTAARFDRMVNHESGLLGVSETSSDVRDLLAREADDERAADALALFCYEAKKQIGSFAAALGGLDTLVFAGGIGENAPIVRARICEGLGFLGVELDPGRNSGNEALISAATGRVAVRVIATDEERMIATSVLRLLHPGPHGRSLP